mmetsp:Transcript_53497/g.142135  ORF Transcript_53497/g.142135 Transcript_53497/m.142135 type:complete len:206 (+) Transcript_53497:1223-1840(+)
MHPSRTSSWISTLVSVSWELLNVRVPARNAGGLMVSADGARSLRRANVESGASWSDRKWETNWRPVRPCRYKRLRRLGLTPMTVDGMPSSSFAYMLRTVTGGLSNPSRRNPCRTELVTASTKLCRQAANADFPCQSRTAVTCPIFTSSSRQDLNPSRQLRSSMSSSSRGSPTSSTWQGAQHTPLYPNNHRSISHPGRLRTSRASS